MNRDELTEKFHDSMLKEWLLPCYQDRNRFDDVEHYNNNKLKNKIKELEKDLAEKYKDNENLKEKLQVSKTYIMHFLSMFNFST